MFRRACIVLFMGIVGVFGVTGVWAESVDGALLQVTGKGSSAQMLVMVGPKVQKIGFSKSAVVKRGETDAAAKSVRPEDLQPGDQLSIDLDQRGDAQSVTARYVLTQGRIRTVLKSSILLDDGRLVQVNPNAKVATEAGTAVSYTVLQRDDYVKLKLNPASEEVWRIVLSDQTPQPRIVSITHDASKPLKPGDTLTVTMEGTPDCLAAFSVAGVVSNVKMAELTPGRYVGAFQVKSATDSVKSAAVVGRLSKGDKTADPIQASALIAISKGQAPEVVVTANPKNQPAKEVEQPAAEQRPAPSKKTAQTTGSASDIAILSPSRGTQVYDPLTVVGRAKANSRVHVTVSYNNNMVGLLRLQGTIDSEELKTDGKGTFRSNPISLPQVFSGKDLVITIKVEPVGEKLAWAPAVVKVRTR